MTRQERKNSITKSALGFTQMAQLEQTLVIGIMIGKLEKAAEEEAKAKEQSRQKTAQEERMQKDFLLAENLTAQEVKLMWRIKEFLEDAAIPIIGGIIGSFIGMGIATLLGIL